MARLILNIDERMMIHLNLNSVYKIVDFDNYPISLETRKFRKDFLVKMFDKLGVKSDKKILDLGCGTGWLIGDLMDAHFSNVKGFDKSEKNLEIARQKYGDNFVEGDWERLSGLVDQQKAIVSLGRTLPHVESDFGFDNVLENVYYALDNNGYFIFDMPDPTVEESEYKKEVSRYRDVLKKFGCESVDIDNVFCIVDSPDGENFYNRYVPPKETILEKLEMFDFEVLEVINEKIPGYIHDRNMVFVCQKKRITNY
jgi:ubiquinone/menaquinone biosynthesis C-methylase UbiE